MPGPNLEQEVGSYVLYLLLSNEQMLLNSIAAVCPGAGIGVMGTTCLHFVAKWPGKNNIYEIYELKGYMWNMAW